MIVVYHSQALFGASSAVWASLAEGVSFFFVLSGFILTYVYPSLETRQKVFRFWVARVARIWPAHLTALLLVLLLLPARQWTLPTAHPLTALFANAFMLHAWLPYAQYFFSYNAPSWSISTEFGFYILFPLLIQRWSRSWALKLSCSFLLLVAIIAACNLGRLPSAAPPFHQNLTATAFIYVNPLGRLFEFTLGMSLALFWMKHRNIRISRSVATVVELALIALIVLGLALLKRQPTSLDRFIGNAGSEYLLHSGCCLLFGAFICCMAWGRGWISALLSYSVPVVLGEISYSIYLVHQILLRFYFVHPGLIVLPSLAIYAIFWLLLIAGTWAIWMAIERPCRRKLVEWFAPKLTAAK